MADEYPVGEHEVPDSKNPMLSDSLYKKLEFITRVILPAFAVLYGTVAGIWGLPYGVEIPATVVAVDLFLGVFIGVAQKSFDNSDQKFAGEIQVKPNMEEPDLADLNLLMDSSKLSYLTEGDVVRLKVTN